MKKILIIEDNEDIRSNTAEILELSNYKVTVAENGKAGVAKALENLPDLVICDIMMPELDGYGVLHALQKNDATKNIPFIFLTAKAERNDMRKAMDLGADDYLTKPFDGTELLNAVGSRLKKMELLKKDIHADLNGVHQLLEASSGKAALQMLTENRNVNRYKKKQIIFSEGNHPNRLYYILSGKVKAFKINEEGKELVTELFSTGDFVGHIALLENAAYKYTAEALEDTELAVVPREDFDELIAKNQQIAHKFIQLLARNVSEKENQLLNLAYNSLRKKVANALLMIQNKYRKDKDESFAIDISRENLATVAGTATESLIRTLGDFKNEKLIEIHEGLIRILNKPKLEKLFN
ncbi:response regulator [Agriterribacter sp.]|uniref:response regulator n=1 Tax=Agriterribacter sp. TaxID=2821509 RepID=UPI002CC84868|nr:response regulator [Agriterribacter sp.]HRP54784.1 response regulator [Agriterribacter sp.]